MPHKLGKLGNHRKLGNFKKIPEMLEIIEEVLRRPPKKQVLIAVLQNCKKLAVSHSIEKPGLLDFLELSKYFI